MKPAVLLSLLCSIALAAASCSEEDTGNCCQSITNDADVVPVSDSADGGLPRNLVAEDPTFDCERLACVSWQGSDAFCTRRCTEGRPCPDGFDCRPVLESDPGVGATITPTTTFCVRKTCTGPENCPEDYECQVAFEGGGTTVRHCVRPSQVCKSN